MKNLFSVLLLSISLSFSLYAQTWQPIGELITPGDLRCLHVHDDKLYVGGGFNQVGTQPALGMFAWDGRQVVEVFNDPSFLFFPFSTVLVEDFGSFQGDLFVLGAFGDAGYWTNSPDGTSTCSRWNGVTLTDSLFSTDGPAYAFLPDGMGFYVGGNMDSSAQGGVNQRAYIGRVGYYDGISYAHIGEDLNFGQVYALEKFQNDLYAGGVFRIDTSATAPQHHIARWNGQRWQRVSLGLFGGTVFDMQLYQGDLYVCGMFQQADNLPATTGIARWDGTSWHSVGGGLTLNTFGARAMVVHQGELYVGGDFSQAGGLPAQNIAKWNGSSWASVGGGLSEWVNDLAVFHDTLYAASFNSNTPLPLMQLPLIGVSIEEEIQASFSLRPNPTQDQLHIRLSASRLLPSHWRIFNLLGQQLAGGEMRGSSMVLDVSTLPEGMYWFEMKGMQKKFRIKD